MSEKISVHKKVKPKWVFSESYWDIIPVLMGIAHFGFFIFFMIAFNEISWTTRILMGLAYSYMIAWNIESVAHNFIHNPYFKSKFINRVFSLMESLSIGFSQQFYQAVHMRHHMGNSDRPDESGKVIDWFSIYRHGKNAAPESALAYSFFGPFRSDSSEVYMEMGRNDRNKDVRWSKFENIAHFVWFGIAFIINWKFMLFFLPFYYLGHVASMMVGYYEHYMANPDLPIAWGVSTYGKMYNLFWMNNGYHAEHHYRPKMHWMRMEELRRQIKDEQQASNVRVINYSHMFGFLQKAG